MCITKRGELIIYKYLIAKMYMKLMWQFEVLNLDSGKMCMRSAIQCIIHK